MTEPVSYELQTYRGGQWRIDSVFDDREIALFEAHRLETSGRFAGIRVVQERFDPATGGFVTKTVYRGAATDQENAQVLARQKEVREQAVESRKARAAARKPPRGRPKRSGVSMAAVRFTLTLGAILLLGIAVIILLREIGGVT